MKKTNIVVAVVAVALALFLIWLWYFLGFNKVDAPLDMVMSIIWIVCVIIFAVVLNKQEETRRELVRRVFFANGVLYNSETGMRSCAADGLAAATQQILEGLQYGMLIQDKPEAFEYDYIVRTEVFDQQTLTDEQTGEDKKVVTQWTGSLFNRETGAETPFSGREELNALIAAQVA